MNNSQVQLYIQKLIEPLYLQIQTLQKQNNDLKKRIDCLQTQQMTQTARTYMRNTTSRQNQVEGSRITRREEENRSLSGSKQKQGWNTYGKIESPKIISKDIAQHQRFKTKPPIPRMNSKTPSKNNQQLAREKSPAMDKKIIGGQQSTQSISTSTKPIPQLKISQTTSSLQMSQTNQIHLQKQQKINIVSTTQYMIKPLQRSTLTEKAENNIKIDSQQNLTHSQ